MSAISFMSKPFSDFFSDQRYYRLGFTAGNSLGNPIFFAALILAVTDFSHFLFFIILKGSVKFHYRFLLLNLDFMGVCNKKSIDLPFMV